ncbi:MAG: hypothetical protein EKK49_21120 [Rhodocyclaceae bacterium]|jgi:hypothetical protein|nr:MAG: hypothetical protein EKK49_21120 [Rhodocyclaceae bacterium]
MTYEEHLDEVATLLFERYKLTEQAAIQLVMKAQADGYFSGHDDDPSICTQLRAEQDAKRVFKEYSKPAAAKPFTPPRGRARR